MLRRVRVGRAGCVQLPTARQPGATLALGRGHSSSRAGERGSDQICRCDGPGPGHLLTPCSPAQPSQPSPASPAQHTCPFFKQVLVLVLAGARRPGRARPCAVGGSAVWRAPLSRALTASPHTLTSPHLTPPQWPHLARDHVRLL